MDHIVYRSMEMGWSELKNGELLQAAEGQGFEVLMTADQNFSSQQNLSGRNLAIVVLPSGQWPKVKMRLSEIVAAVDGAQAGSFTQIVPDDPGRHSRELSST